MRHAALLPALLFAIAAPAFADEASDLFYRAFWLEQSGANSADAEKLYRELVEKHPDAPEAPRAHLALIRMNAARGIKVDDMLRALEKGYPDAAKEIELARKLAARTNVAFDAASDREDTPLERKLKVIYKSLDSGQDDLVVADWGFLLDAGAAAHPMLGAALRSFSDKGVYNAARALVRENSDAAAEVLVQALNDERVLYRLRILDAVKTQPRIHPRIVDALDALWAESSRSLRRGITSVLARQTFFDNPERDRCYALLARALKEDDDEMRRTALSVDGRPPYVRPLPWARAVLDVLPLPETQGVPMADHILPWQVAHEEIRAAVEQHLIEREGPVNFANLSGKDFTEAKVTDAMAESWARIALGRAGKQRKDQPEAAFRELIRAACWASPDMVRMLARAGLERGDMQVLVSVQSSGRAKAILAGRTELIAEALEQCYAAEEERRNAASFLLSILECGVDDIPAIREAAERHESKGLPFPAMLKDFLVRIGPDRAATLVPLASAGQVETLFRQAQYAYRKEETRGLAFYRVLVPRAQPAHVGYLYTIAGDSPELDLVVARRMCTARGEEWGWDRDEQSRNVSGSKRSAYQICARAGIRNALADPSLRDALYAAIDDEREVIAEIAVRTAGQNRSDASFAALTRCMRAPWMPVRLYAIGNLGTYGERAAAVLVERLKEPGLESRDREAIWEVLTLCIGPQQLAYVQGRLDARPGNPEAQHVWGLAWQLDRDATIERAFREVFGQGPDEFRDEALEILQQCSDDRRIEVFRKVLRERQMDDRTHRVLNTVADQYLIELGPEVLLHLRSPNAGIRKTATNAIERLKFYAEAKKLFEKEGG